MKSIFKKVQQVGGKFSIEDATRIEYDVNKRYNKKSIVAVENKEKTLFSQEEL